VSGWEAIRHCTTPHSQLFHLHKTKEGWMDAKGEGNGDANLDQTSTDTISG